MTLHRLSMAQEHSNSAGDAHLISGSKIKYRREFNDPQMSEWTVSSGPGQVVASGSGVATVTMGTTANAETTLTTLQAFTAPFKVSAGIQLSQKIANNEIYLELVAVGPGGEGVDESVVAAWRIAGSDTTSATTARYEVRNGGTTRLQSGNVTVATPVGVASIFEITLESDEVWFTSKAVDSSAGRTMAGVRNSVSPDPNLSYRVRLRVKNGATAPASATTATFHFVTAVDYTELQTEVTGGNGNASPGQAIPVNVVQGATSSTPSLAASASVTGTTTAKVLSAATANPTLVKSTAGRLYGYHLVNTSTTWRYLKLFSKATAPVAGTDVPIMQIPIPPGGVSVVDRSVPITFALGIGYTITTGPADNDSGVTAANDVSGHLLFL